MIAAYVTPAGVANVVKEQPHILAKRATSLMPNGAWH